MLSQLFPDSLTLRIMQTVVTLVVTFAVLGLAYSFRIAIVRNSVIAIVRGLLQVVGIGSVLLLVFRSPSWTSVLVLAAMLGIASHMATRRFPKFPRILWPVSLSIMAGAFSVLALMTLVGVVDARSAALIPIGSMLIANTMTTVSLLLDRLQAEIRSHTGHIETALALGAIPEVAVDPYVQSAVQAALLPRIDTIQSLGIIWIPGLMTGMLLSGAEPIQAALYQFVIVAMIFTSGIISSLCCVLLCRHRFFSSTGCLQTALLS